MEKQEPMKVKVKNTSVLPSAVMLKPACQYQAADEYMVAPDARMECSIVRAFLSRHDQIVEVLPSG